MPKILKILGKSVLCFAGLVAAGWGIFELFLMIIPIEAPQFFIVLILTVIGYILWFLLASAYTYALYLLFKNEKRRCMIMVLNGAVLFLLIYVLIYIFLYPNYYLYSHTNLSSMLIKISKIVGPTTIVLAFMLNNLSLGKVQWKENTLSNKAINVLEIASKSILCFIALAAISHGYNLLLIYLLSKSAIYEMLLDSNIIWPLMAAVYAFVLYRLLKKNVHRQLIIFLNAAFLMIVWCLLLIPDLLPQLFDFKQDLFAMVCGNTAFMTIALSFIFRSVESHGTLENSYYKDSSVENALSE